MKFYQNNNVFKPSSASNWKKSFGGLVFIATALIIASCGGGGGGGAGAGAAAPHVNGGAVSTLAGTGVAGSADGAGNVATFNSPSGVATDSAGNVYVADMDNHKIRKITPAGAVSTLAGTGVGGSADGAGNAATFNFPSSVATDSAGNVYVVDLGNNRIRKITPAGVVSALAGTGVFGFADGAGNVATFNVPTGLATDSAGNVYVADKGNELIRKITPAGLVSTLAGTGAIGFAEGAGNVATFSTPVGVATDSAGNVYVADFNNHTIREIQ